MKRKRRGFIIDYRENYRLDPGLSVAKKYLCSMIKQQVSQYIEKKQLFRPEDRILVALSGGADSVALLRILLSLGYACEAAHCNFHLRAEESDRDEAFTRNLCQELQVSLHIRHFNTVEHAEKRKISIEMAARELRYQWFDEIKKETGAIAIAVAHHQDDSAETLLLNLIRGTGINGLLGIRPKNDNIVRPLLCTTRQELILYLERIGQKYVTDSTNLQDEFTRNKIRLNLIPLMQEINPSVKKSLINTCEHLSEVHQVYEQALQESEKRVRTPEGIRIDALLKEVSPKAVLFHLLHPLGFNSSQLENIFDALSGQPGKQFTGTQGWRVIKDREYLYINKVNEENNLSPFSLEIKEETYAPDFPISADKNIAYIDAERVKQPFSIRKWQKGDAFIPLGMKGRKKISDYLTDRKFSLLQKENQWVLCCENDIVWLIGERIDHRYRIQKETKRVLIIQIRKNKANN